MPSYTRVNIEATLLFILSILRFSMADTSGFSWGYHGASGPKFWPEHVPTCGGRSQSPVDIQSSRYNSSLGDFNFSGYDATGTDMYKIKNNGHTTFRMPGKLVFNERWNNKDDYKSWLMKDEQDSNEAHCTSWLMKDEQGSNKAYCMSCKKSID